MKLTFKKQKVAVINIKKSGLFFVGIKRNFVTPAALVLSSHLRAAPCSSKQLFKDTRHVPWAEKSVNISKLRISDYLISVFHKEQGKS